MGIPLVSVAHQLKALADDSRLRILAALSPEPLSVNELLAVVQMGQSRVSRHLKILSEAGFLRHERIGSRVYYGLVAPGPDSSVARFLHALGLPATPGRTPDGFPVEVTLDLSRLAHLLENRRQDSLEHFQKYGIDQDHLQMEFVDADFYRQAILAILPDPPGLTVDLGCGPGLLAGQLLGRGAEVIGIDQSSNLLARARRNCPAGDFRAGTLERIPLDDGQADLVIAAMVLHHLPDPARGLREIFRVLRPGGYLIVADLERHEEEAMLARFADFWPGFEAERLREMLAAEGFSPEQTRKGRGAGRLSSVVLLARRVGATKGPRKTGTLAQAGRK